MSPPPTGQHFKLWSWTTALFIAVLLAAGFGVGLGAGSYFRPSRYPAPGNSTLKQPPGKEIEPAIADLEHRYEMLKIRLDDIAESSKRIDQLVTLLLTLSTLYALALGLNSYFGLKQILETAKEDFETTLKRAKSGFRVVFREIREKYPEFANLHQNLDDLLDRLATVFPPGEDWLTHAYSTRPEKVLLAELHFAGIEAFRLEAFPSYRTQVTGIYQGLGRFYCSKFATEKIRSDWERASLYFQETKRLGSLSSSQWTDIGTHLTQLDWVAYHNEVIPNAPAPTQAELEELEGLRKQAQLAFRRALEQNEEEPSALLGLGFIFHRRRDYPEAIRYYSRVTTIANWKDNHERDRYWANAWYSCATCRVLAGCHDTAQAAQVFHDLKESKEVAARRGRLAPWREEIREDPDFQNLFRQYPREVRDLLA